MEDAGLSKMWRDREGLQWGRMLQVQVKGKVWTEDRGKEEGRVKGADRSVWLEGTSRNRGDD